MFAGTLPSNLGEGAAAVRAYALLGYAAIAIGNHEFDFGPIGPATPARTPSDDPRGALRARAAEAPFPFLDANEAHLPGPTSSALLQSRVDFAVMIVEKHPPWP
jgi:5'-nucleotidase